MYKALENLYSQVLISEMNQAVVDYIDENKNYLPFHDIFGDELRIAIPLETDAIGLEIIDALSKIEGYNGLTPSHEVLRKIKLDPKYGKGDYKAQLINIGKAIQSLKIPDDVKKKYLNWYARYKDSLYDLQHYSQSEGDLDEYAIVLSRAPIDLVRMSDHDRITSCHSRTGSHFECAVQEAISGGAIAYLVKKESVQKAIDADRFQEADLFKDYDRGVSGPTPKARLRIRMLDLRMPTDKDKHNIQEIAVPETRIYGDASVPNFYRTVKNYIRNVQPYSADSILNAIGEGGREKVSLRGGTYTDNDLHTLLDSLYDRTEEFNPNIYHHQPDMTNQDRISADELEDVDQEAIAEEQKDELERELDNIETRYFSAEHSSVGYYSDINWDGGEAYIYYDANGQIVIDLDSDYETDTDFPDEIDSYELVQLRSKNGNTSNLKTFGSDDDIAKLKKFIQALNQYDPTKSKKLLDCVESISNNSSSQFIFRLKFNGGDGSSSDPSDYKDFIEDVVNMLDENYDGIKKAVQKALAVSGYIENESSGVDYTEYKNAQELLDELEHIRFENNVIQIGMSIPIDRRNVITLKGFDDEVSGAMGNFLVNYLTKEYKQSVNKPEQLEFSKLYESFDSPSLKKFGIYDVDGTLESNDMIAGSYIELSINLDVLGLNLGVINLMQFLDKNFKDIQNVGAIIVYQLLLDKGGYVEEGYLNRLKHVYGQYMQPM
jgi:hypothetical protein